jgi:hypothetical protein
LSAETREISASLANLGDNVLSLFGAAAVMNENLGASLGERKRAGAAYATRGAGDQRGFSSETRHGPSPCGGGREAQKPHAH